MVALDIGHHSIKIAEFLMKKKEPYLNHFAVFPVPENCMNHGHLSTTALKEPLQSFMSAHNMSQTRNVSIAIGGRSVFVKKIEILKSEKNMMDEMVEMAVKDLPFEAEEINYDYQVISQPESFEKDKLNVLLIVALRKIVFSYNDLFTNMGCKLRNVDMQGFALESCFKAVYPEAARRLNDNVVILDIGRQGTHFIVLHGGRLIFNRYLALGSQFYITSIMKEMGVDFQEAESLYLGNSMGSEAPAQIHQIIEENNRYFCDEIMEGSEYFKNQFPEQSFSECYITGGAGKLSSLVQEIGKALSVPSQVFDPFLVLKYNEHLSSAVPHIKHFVPITMGLCLREIG